MLIREKKRMPVDNMTLCHSTPSCFTVIMLPRVKLRATKVILPAFDQPLVPPAQKSFLSFLFRGAVQRFLYFKTT